MVELIASKGWAELSRGLVTVLGGCGAQHSDRLISRWLRHDRWEFRFLAASALGNMGLSRALNPLLECVSDSREELPVRIQAAWAVGKIGGPAATEALEALPPEDEQSLSDALDWALSYFIVDVAYREQFFRLCHEVLSSAGADKCWVYRAIGRRHDECLYDQLLSGLDDTETSVRGDAVLALARLAGRDEKPRLLKAYGDASTSREWVLCYLALLTIGDPPPDDPDLLSLRRMLAGESWMYARPTRIDIVETLRDTDHADIADAWEPVYDSV
jgi:HEAT repeat protein